MHPLEQSNGCSRYERMNEAYVVGGKYDGD